MKKAFLYLPLTLGMAFGGVSLLSSTAYADDSCASGYSCYYDFLNGGGKIWTAPGPGCYDVPRDRITSVRNRGGATVYLYNWDYLSGGGVGYVLTAAIPVGDAPVNLGGIANNTTDVVCVDY